MFGWNEDVTKINILIQKKKYNAAIKLLRKELHKSPDSQFMKQQLAGLLGKAGKTKEALRIMNSVAEKYTQDGFLTKALAMYKQMERLDPDQFWIHEKITDLGRQHRGKYDTDRLQTPFVKDKSFETVSSRGQLTDEGIEVSNVEEDLEFDVQGGSLAETEVEINTLFEGESELQVGPDPIYASPLFRNISEGDLSAFIHGLGLRSYEPGEIIFTEGEPGHSLMVLASGSLRVYVKNKDARNEQVRTLEEGAFFGEISLLTGKPRTATIIAGSYTELLELDQPTLTRISEKHPDVQKVLQEFYLKRSNSPEERKARS
ncbi:MAG: hypothetical protein CSA81_07805 [Acidobacteria bacterium]|nr:MAG: hypothetical protein CSA81_07805 [Acidobacteriota bacterium]